MTTNHFNDDLVALGSLPPSHTHGARVAHSRPGFIGVADGLPINDTASTVCSGQKSAAPVAIGPAPHSVTANNRAATAPGARFKPKATAALSLLVAVVASAVAVALIAVAGSRAGTPGPVTTTALAATALCGLVLIAAACVGTGGRR